jgi:Rrf2 family protein
MPFWRSLRAEPFQSALDDAAARPRELHLAALADLFAVVVAGNADIPDYPSLMRMSAKAEYAVRAMVQLATVEDGTVVKTDDLAKAQGIPPQFLVDILSDLRNDRLVRSHRGREGGYELARPAADIGIADVLRCIDGPLASVRDIGLGDLPYSGPTSSLTDVWRALRASMRSVLEQTTLADVAAGALPEHVCLLADDYRGQEEERGHSVG